MSAAETKSAVAEADRIRADIDSFLAYLDSAIDDIKQHESRLRHDERTRALTAIKERVMGWKDRAGASAEDVASSIKSSWKEAKDVVGDTAKSAWNTVSGGVGTSGKQQQHEARQWSARENLPEFVPEELRDIIDKATRQWQSTYTVQPGLGSWQQQQQAAIGGRPYAAAPVASIHGVVYMVYLFWLVRRVFALRHATGVFVGDGAKELAVLEAAAPEEEGEPATPRKRRTAAASPPRVAAEGSADYKMEILHSLRHAVQGRRDYIAFIPMVWLCLLTAELNGAGWKFLNLGYLAAFGPIFYSIEYGLQKIREPKAMREYPIVSLVPLVAASWAGFQLAKDYWPQS